MDAETAYCVQVANRDGVFFEKKNLTFGGAVAVAVLKKHYLSIESTVVVSNLDRCDYDSYGLTDDEQIIVDDALDEVVP